MEKKIQSLSLVEFQQRFPDYQNCMEYLVATKWSDGFICEQCSHQKYCNGKLKQTRECTSCGYQATPTSGTLFHKVAILKFPLLKVFYIIYFMSTHKKGIFSTELSRKLSLRQKPRWLFRKKVTQAMKSSKQYPLEGIIEIDEMVIGQQEEGGKGRENDKKQPVIVAIEKKGTGVSRMYARVVNKASKKTFNPFFQDHIAKKDRGPNRWLVNLHVLPKRVSNPNARKEREKGENFNDMHRIIIMFTGWMRGIHPSVDHLQDYLNEYSYRFNRRYMDGAIFDNLLLRAVKHQPVPLNLRFFWQPYEYRLSFPQWNRIEIR